MNRRIADTLALLAACIFLGGAAVERCILMPPASAVEYHRCVANSFLSFPIRVGDWLGTDVPVPVAATKVLRSNTILSRSYFNATTRERCSVLLIHCSDARDLLAHYPPICYPGQGWKLVSSDPHTWLLNGRAMSTTVYEFSRNQFESSTGIVSVNAMLLPDGSCVPDMHGLEAAARDPYRRHFGAAQLQVIFDGAIGQQERDQITRSMLGIHQPLFEALRINRD